ncbi:MAG: hypothetical protein WA056_10435 [Gallionella sp.]
MSGIGFLVGYFMMYSIRSGTKTQDAFKSFLGVGALAGGAFFEHLTGVGNAGGGAGVAASASSASAAASQVTSAQTIADHAASTAQLAGVETGLLLGALAYFLISLVLGAVYSFSQRGDSNLPAAPVNVLSVVLGRILLGEDFRTPAPK